MAFRPGQPRPTHLFLNRRRLSVPALASSAGLHVIAFALVVRLTSPLHVAAPSAPALRVTRAYAVQYLFLPPRTPEPTAKPERRPASRPRPVAPIAVPNPPASALIVADEGSQAGPPQQPRLATALPPGSVAGVGPGIAPGGPDRASGPGPLGRLGFRPPEGGPTPRGATRVVELASGAGTACPALRRPPGRREYEVAVAIAFVVDTSGTVDPATLRVVESPDRPRTEQRYYSHIYAVGMTARIDGRMPDAAADYDSVLTEEVATHIRDLRFRPAMREGRAIRATVLVSCQSPDPDGMSAR
jgi:hypothetical protein